MAERGEPELAEDAEPSIETDAAATAAALDEARGDPALRPDLQAFFAAQRTLIEAQTHHLGVQLRHLGLKIVGERLRVLLQLLTAVGVAGLLVVVGFIVFDAMDDHGLVIESFATAPALTARGLTGEVLADQMLGRIAAIRRLANANSITVSDDVRSGGGNAAVKLEIPETGLSLDQVQRFLHQALGHARRVTGAVRDDGQGHAAVEVQVSGGDPVTVEGASGDLDALMQQTAEKAFGVFDPVNYVLYLRGVGRSDDALVAAERNFKLGKTPIDVSNGLSLWANTDGDRRRALLRATLAAETYPKGWAGWSESVAASRDLGHDEAALGFARRLIGVHVGDQWRNHRPAFPYLIQRASGVIDRLLGDYGRLDQQLDRPAAAGDWRSPSDRYLEQMDPPLGRHDCGPAEHELVFARTAGPPAPADELQARFGLAVCRGDWGEGLAVAQERVSALETARASAQATSAGFVDQRLATSARPLLAQALSRNGRLAEAEALIAGAPLDCYLCVRVRGEIAAAKGDGPAVDRWFGEAVRQAPSLPFAYVEWARARLARGDAAGAIAKLRLAADKSPNFPDTREVWGEALVRQGEPSRALEQFQRAERLAPRWGRLHLAWGEALQGLGRPDQAARQFAEAAELDLSAADRADLVKRAR